MSNGVSTTDEIAVTLSSKSRMESQDSHEDDQQWRPHYYILFITFDVETQIIKPSNLSTNQDRLHERTKLMRLVALIAACLSLTCLPSLSTVTLMMI